MVDRRPRRALGRGLKITQGHVAWQLWRHPMEVSQLVAVRATSAMVGAFGQEKENTWVLVVSNQFFEPTVERLTQILDASASVKFSSEDFARHLREQATELCVDAPDFTPLLIFVYLGLPVAVLHFSLLAIQRILQELKLTEMVLPPEHRD